MQSFYGVLAQYALQALARDRAPLARIFFVPRKPGAGRRASRCAAPRAFELGRSMDYALLKTIHQSAVVLSFAGFFVRGIGMLNDATWLRHRAVKTLPHVVDTVLIVSALWLAWILRLTPTNAPWIGAKIVGLFVYIGVGMVALRFGRTKAVRAGAWVAAMLTFGYIVSVAITKDPRGFLLWI